NVGSLAEGSQVVGSVCGVPQIKKPKALTSGLNFFCFGTTERIPSVRDESIQFFREMQYLFPIYFQY
ncbi:hypothetical protein, partial [Enterobacter hormaechei]|uniref:hypothetical protein n=1 Tax=Enterobacter hormaechei TaxID=158836 RepID=UPI000665A150